MKTYSKLLLNVASLACLLLSVRAPAQPLSAIDKNAIIATLHAEGAQIYECKPDTSTPAGQARALKWQFREPIATLMVGGQTVGRHYAGPSWDLVDGDGVRGRVVTSTFALPLTTFHGWNLKWLTTATRVFCLMRSSSCASIPRVGLRKDRAKPRADTSASLMPQIIYFCARATNAVTAAAWSHEMIGLAVLSESTTGAQAREPPVRPVQ
jgi:Protein of unknown function (DUF3455)